MKTFTSIKEYPQNQRFLSNDNWRETEYHELCCKNELWGCAFLVTIEKEITDDANEAVIYILKRFVIEGESWDETLQKDINADDFVKFILGSGYISNDKGWFISINEFWTNYEEIINGIAKEKNFELTKNGLKTEYSSLTKKEEILSVICFADKWNNRQYLLETKTKWGFFSWATGV